MELIAYIYLSLKLSIFITCPLESPSCRHDFTNGVKPGSSMLKLVPGLLSVLLQSELVGVLGVEVRLYFGLHFGGDFCFFVGDTANIFLGDFKVHAES